MYFPKNKDGKFGLRSICKKCLKEYTGKYYKSNKEKVRKVGKLWEQNNKEKLNSKKFSKNIVVKYNISIDEYNVLLELQHGVCKICGLKSNKRLCVDHCHKTNKIRGLLCHSCNIGLGYFKDNINNLQNAIKYLETK